MAAFRKRAGGAGGDSLYLSLRGLLERAGLVREDTGLDLVAQPGHQQRVVSIVLHPHRPGGSVRWYWNGYGGRRATRTKNTHRSERPGRALPGGRAGGREPKQSA